MANGLQQETKMPKKTKRRNIAIIILLIVSIISTLAMLIILGSLSTPDYLGKIIDTIPLKPKDETNSEIHLYGKVRYADGTPAAGKTLVLHSEPRYTMSDKYGCFLYTKLIPGEHTLTVLNSDGSIAAKTCIEIKLKLDITDIDFSSNDKGTVIEICPNLRILELEIELDLDTGTLVISDERHSELLRNGQVKTPTGMANVANGVIVTPGGMIFMPDGSIIIPSDGIVLTAVIASDDTVSYIEDETELYDVTIYFPSGKIQLSDGTIIENGTIKTPDGTETTPGEGGVQIITTHSGDQPTDVIPIGEDTGKLKVSEQSAPGDSISWSQGNAIDLFYNRTAGIGSHEIVAPGSAGYYLFSLSNTRTRELKISITLEESGNVHLPLVIKLTPLDDKGSILKDKTIQVTFPNNKLSLNDTIASGASTVYLLEWEWPFEGNDKLDTMLGIKSGDYTLSLEIYAEER